MHRKISHEIIEFLHQKFPKASIGLSGSVANGTYNENSDVDLLFLRKEYLNSYYIYFMYEGVKIGIFSFHKKMFLQKNLDLLFDYHNMRTSYILNSTIVWDPDYLIQSLIGKIEENRIKRVLFRGMLINELKNEISDLLKLGNNSNNILILKRSYYQILGKIMSIYFLRIENNMIFSKINARDPFSLINKQDKKLYNMIYNCYPINNNSQLLLEKHIVPYIFNNY